jgi:hypothetical protein
MTGQLTSPSLAHRDRGSDGGIVRHLDGPVSLA